MKRRDLLRLGAVGTGIFAVGGLNTIIVVHREMPKKLVMPSTGTRVIFGA
jgi:hypothetical protein